MTGGSLSYNELSVLRTRSELFSLEDDEELHPSVRPRTSMGVPSIRITEYAQTSIDANPQPRRQQQAGEEEAPTQFLSPTRLVCKLNTALFKLIIIIIMISFPTSEH